MQRNQKNGGMMMTSLRVLIAKTIFLARYNRDVISEAYADEIIKLIEKRIDELKAPKKYFNTGSLGWNDALEAMKEMLK